MSKKAVDPKEKGKKRADFATRFGAERGNKPGRPVGARNKLSEDFLGDLHTLWQDRGPEMLNALAADDPATIVRACVAILPKEHKITMDPLDDMTDEQLREHARRIAEHLGPIFAFAGTGADAGEDQGTTRH